MLEKRIKQAVKERLKQLGAYQHWGVPYGMGGPSLDCIGCYRGHYVGIECKAPGKKPTPLQEMTMAQIRAAGGSTYVVDSLETAADLLADFVAGHQDSASAGSARRRSRP